MVWKQLVTPNLSVVGRKAYCLVYARNVFNAPPVKPTAWEAWVDCDLKHTDQNFPPVAVPVWFFDESGDPNPGHVAVRLPSGEIYSSPHTSVVGHDVLNTIAQVERYYNVKYIGWSEDINRVRVAQEENEVDFDEGNARYWLKYFVGISEPTANDIEFAKRYMKGRGVQYLDEGIVHHPSFVPAFVLKDRIKELEVGGQYIKVGTIDGEDIYKKKGE